MTCAYSYLLVAVRKQRENCAALRKGIHYSVMSPPDELPRGQFSLCLGIFLTGFHADAMFPIS